MLLSWADAGLVENDIESACGQTDEMPLVLKNLLFVGPQEEEEVKGGDVTVGRRGSYSPSLATSEQHLVSGEVSGDPREQGRPSRGLS